MISLQEIKCIAAKPNLPLNPLVAFKSSPSSIRILDVPKKIGNWQITNVYIQVTYPDNSIISKECVRNGNVWVGTVQGTETTGTSSNGYKILANGIDEDGEEVEGYILGVGDVCIMEIDGSVSPETTAYNIRLYNYPDIPQDPKIGDAYLDQENGSVLLKIFNGDTWVPAGYTDLTNTIKWGDNFVPYSADYIVIKNNNTAHPETVKINERRLVLNNGTDAQKTEITNSTINIGGLTGQHGLLNVAGGIKMQSDKQSDESYVSQLTIDGKNVATESYVDNTTDTKIQNYAMPLNGKLSGLFTLGTNSIGVEWSSKGGYLGIYGDDNSLWLDTGTIVELEDGWEQLKKVVSNKPLQYQTLPDYLSGQIGNIPSVVLSGSYEDGTTFEFECLTK